jgi:hypothetical protein
MSSDETKRLLAVAQNLKVRVLLSLGYGCGLRAGEVIQLKVKHIDVIIQGVVNDWSRTVVSASRVFLMRSASIKSTYGLFGSYRGISCRPAFQDYSYSWASPMRACALSIHVFDEEFEVARPCTFMVDTERCRSGLVATSAISFLTMARPNEL